MTGLSKRDKTEIFVNLQQLSMLAEILQSLLLFGDEIIYILVFHPYSKLYLKLGSCEFNVFHLQ